MPRVLVAHRHALVREALAAVLAAEPGAPEVATAGSAAAARRLAAGGRPPDAALVDAALPGGEGPRLIGELAAAGARVVAVAETAGEAAAARAAGAHAVACARRPLPALLAALRAEAPAGERPAAD
jgi:DNA-binding NarL/FixJ family response regulator